MSATPIENLHIEGQDQSDQVWSFWMDVITNILQSLNDINNPIEWAHMIINKTNGVPSAIFIGTKKNVIYLCR